MLHRKPASNDTVSCFCLIYLVVVLVVVVLVIVVVAAVVIVFYFFLFFSFKLPSPNPLRQHTGSPHSHRLLTPIPSVSDTVSPSCPSPVGKPHSFLNPPSPLLPDVVSSNSNMDLTALFEREEDVNAALPLYNVSCFF